MNADEVIAEVRAKARGRTRFDGQDAYRDEILVAEIERLRAALKRIANHPDARDSIVSIAAAELDEQIAASE
jgi:hypothetical protein